MKKLAILLSLTFCFFVGLTQTTTIPYNTPFSTTNQNLWQQGSTGIFQIDHVFFTMPWNTGNSTFGGISSVVGFDFGAEVTAKTWGEIGSGLEINFGTEQVDIDYNTITNIKKPTDFTFDNGDNITINTSYTPLASSNIVTDNYDLNMNLWMDFGMGIKLGADVCVFSCADVDIVDFDMPVKRFDMVNISSQTGISLLDGQYTWGVDEAFPFSYTDPKDIISVDITLPSNSGANIYLKNNDLHSDVDPTDPYFNVYFSIPKFIGALSIPYVSAFFENLSNSYESGPFYLNYTLMEAGFNLGLYHKQHLVFDPTLTGRFDLATAVNYKIVNPNNGYVISQGYDSTIYYTVGDDVQIDVPCNYEFLDVTPSFDIENTFTNQTYDSIALDFVFKMLEFNIGMNDVTVIDAYCVDIPYPCPTWDNPFKWCSKEVCTPAVVFDGFNYGFGPLVDWQPNLYNVKYDWCNNSWEMQGFNSFPNMNSFRLEPRMLDVEMTVNPVLCSNESTGSATATVVNGTPPYTYEWSNGEVVTTNSTTNTQTNLDAGSQYVVVSDVNDCSVFASEIIIEPSEPLSFEEQTNNPLCFDSNDGSIQVNISGGTPGYTYTWNNGETTANITNLDAGEYILNVIDNNGCKLSHTFILSKPDSISTLITSQDVLCNSENTGYINIEVEGGVPHYEYLWSNGNTTNSDSNLVAGTYIITISDFNSCKKTDTIEISEPDDKLNSYNSITNVSCYGDSTGQIDITPIGGTLPYTYTWYNSNFNIINQSTPQLVNMPAGNYSLVLSDSQNCTDSVNMTINQTDSLSYEYTVQNVLCNGLSTGEILLTLDGGTPPYSYNWSNGSTVNPATGLAAGEYTVTVTDTNNCEYFLNSTVSQPSEPLMISIETTNVRCFGESTGSILANPSGGTAPYSYLWSNDSTKQELVNIPAGIYNLTATDANNCVYYSGGVVSEPESALSITSNVSPVSCFGYQDGSINIEIFGGTIPFYLTWDNNTYLLSSNQQILDNLLTGYYNITITDSNNCSIEKQFFIDSPDTVLINFTSTMVSCYNGSDATLTPFITGGSEPYSYSWSNNSSEQNLSDIPVGDYTLTVTDSNDCIYSASSEITSFPEIIVSSEITPPSCKDIDDASIVLSLVGGTENYYFVWSNGETTKDIENLSEGNYSIIISDENNCEVDLDFQIPYNFVECLKIPSTFSPNNDGINDTWKIINIDAYPNSSVQIFNVWGSLIYKNEGEYIPWNGTYNGNQMPSGTYYYIVDLKNGDTPYTGTVTIVR